MSKVRRAEGETMSDANRLETGNSTVESQPEPNMDRLTAGPISLPHYDFTVDPASDSTHAKVIRLVGSNKRVLEIGPATGYMTEVLRQRGCRVVAVEIDAVMARTAAAFCERLILGDIEKIDLDRELGDDRFDVIVAADVLEHLKDPGRTLTRLRNFLSPDGWLVASVPNIAHGSVRFALLGGSFPYAPRGLLDNSHLRFFTRASMEDLFENADFAIGMIQRQDLQIDQSEVEFDRERIPPSLLDTLRDDPEATTYQFIVVAYPLPRSELKLYQTRMRLLAESLDHFETLRKNDAQFHAVELAAARDQANAFENLVASLNERAQRQSEKEAHWEELIRQRDEIRRLLIDAHDQLARRDDEIQFLRLRESQFANLQQEFSDYRAQADAVESALRGHVDQLQHALDRILYSLPGRVLRFARTAVTFGKR